MLDGVWFLKYTSPSSVPNDDNENEDEDGNNGTTDETNDEWKPTIPKDKRIETKQIQSKGSVSAAGITVDVGDRDTLHIFSFGGEKEEEEGPTLMNEVDLGWGKVVVGGGLRPSDVVYNRRSSFVFNVCFLCLGLCVLVVVCLVLVWFSVYDGDV